MFSISQNYVNVLEKIFQTVVSNSFKLTNFNNYIELMSSLQVNISKSIREAIVLYFEKLDEDFCKSKERKAKYYYSGSYIRTLITIFGEIQFTRRYYYPKDKSSEGFFYLDELLELPRYDCYDQIVKAMLMEEKADSTYAKAGEIVSKKISEYSGQNISISRQTVYNIFDSFEIDDEIVEDDSIIKSKNLYIILDEKFIHTKNYYINDTNKPVDKMIKHVILYTGKKKINNNRYKLLNRHVFSTTGEYIELLNKIQNYIDKHYDINEIENIIISGDGAKWINSFNRDFTLIKRFKKLFVLDAFHVGQAICRITTNKCEREELKEHIQKGSKTNFINLCNNILLNNPDRKDKIESNRDYIASKWVFIKNIKNPLFIGCPMEAHISHDLAKVFSRDPKAYSINTLDKHIKLRDLYLNKFDIKNIYLYSKNYIKQSKSFYYQERILHSNYGLIETANNIGAWNIVNGDDLIKY